LKKAASADQAEIKDLRLKLKLSERGQLSGKQGELGEMKSALQSLESKRREELKDKEHKIGELEKALATECKKRQFSEAKFQEMKVGEDEKIQARVKKLEVQLEGARQETREARSSLDALEEKASEERENLTFQLDQYRSLLSRVAVEYGRLALSSVPITTHAHIKHEHAALRMHVLRLERKLANSEGQVVELANLVRHTKEENAFLNSRLNDADTEALWCWQAITEADTGARRPALDKSLTDDAFAVENAITRSTRRVLEARVMVCEAFCKLYRLTHDQLVFAYSIAEKALHLESENVQQHSADLSKAIVERNDLASDLEVARKVHGTAHEEITKMTAELEEANAQVEMLRGTLAEVETRMKYEVDRIADDLKKEKGATQRLVATMQKQQITEDSLRAEIEQWVQCVTSLHTVNRAVF
jgi:DNA repair exonuclease SbcCD ATPase subunit